MPKKKLVPVKPARIMKPVINSVAHLKLQNGLSEAIMGFVPSGVGTELSQSDTLFKNMRGYLISNLRQLLSQAYLESGLVQTIVDTPVDDAMRGGYEIRSKQMDGEEVEALQTFIDRHAINTKTIGQAFKWNRLFGGAGILIITDQDPATPLDKAAIREDSPLEFRPVDMWELYYDMVNVDGVDQTGGTLETEFYTYYGIKLHKSRVIKLVGIQAPSFLRPRLRGWGASIVESLVRAINQYLKSNDLAFEVLDEFKLDIFKIKGLANTLLSADGTSTVQRRIALANYQKNFQNALTMDSEDDFVQKQLTFSGLAEMMKEFRIQIASDMRMPLTKLFGLSATGFSSGEDDIETYNAMVESQIRSKCKYEIISILEIISQKMFGYIPEDLQIEFRPLRMLSSEQEQSVKTSKLNRVKLAVDSGLCTVKEAKEMVNKEDLLPMKVDTSIETVPEPKPEPDGE